MPSRHIQMSLYRYLNIDVNEELLKKVPGLFTIYERAVDSLAERLSVTLPGGITYDIPWKCYTRW